MDIEKAIRILDPKTSAQEIYEIEYLAGFSGKEKAIEAVNEACIIACECMRKELENLKNHEDH